MAALPERIKEIQESLVTACCMVKTFAVAAFADDCESGDLGMSLEHLHGVMLALSEDAESIADEAAQIEENKGLCPSDICYEDKWEAYISHDDRAARKSEEVVAAIEEAISVYQKLSGTGKQVFRCEDIPRIVQNTGAAFRKQGFMEGYRAAVEAGWIADGE
jgi:hypothetical protein